jgi:hypothetical protein
MTEPPKRRDDPAITLAAKLDDYATRLPADEHRILQAMLVMAMDPLDRQTLRTKSILTPEEAQKVHELLQKK